MKDYTSYDSRDWENLLDKYLNETITQGELHALQYRALDDPFVADALQAYHSHEPDKSRSDIQQIIDKVSGKEEKKKRRVIPMWQISAVAASLLFVAAIGFLLRPDGQEKSSDAGLVSVESGGEDLYAARESNVASEVEDTTIELVIEQHGKGKDLDALVHEDKSAIGVEIIENDVESTNDAKVIIRGNSSDEPLYVIDGIPVDAGRMKSMDKEESHDDDSNVEVENTRESTAAKKKESKRAQEEDTALDQVQTPSLSNSLNYVGQVTDQNGSPLVGASVVMKDSSIVLGGITDYDGNFNMEVPRVGNYYMEVDYTGYEKFHKDVKIDSGNNFSNVILQEGAILSEVVMTGYSIPTSELNFAPQNGYTQFEKYISQNIRKPYGSTLEHLVTIRFNISTDGSLSDFQANDSSCESCNLELIRLLKEGPKWRVNEEVNYPYSAFYSYEF